MILNQMAELLETLPNCTPLQCPTEEGAKFTVCGDVHGQVGGCGRVWVGVGGVGWPGVLALTAARASPAHPSPPLPSPPLSSPPLPLATLTHTPHIIPSAPRLTHSSMTCSTYLP